MEELRAKNMEVPTLLDKAHGLRIESFMIDVLHCADLGVSAHLIGNVFWEVISAKPWANTTEANVSEFTKKDTSRLPGQIDHRAHPHDRRMAKAESKGGVHQALVRARVPHRSTVLQRQPSRSVA